jgi:hypothetical protein
LVGTAPARPPFSWLTHDACACAAYLLADKHTKEAVLIDPVLEMVRQPCGCDVGDGRRAWSLSLCL